MATIQAPQRSLPKKANSEHLHKQAKRLARSDAMQHAAAQRRLAHNYGFRTWAALMAAVQMMAAASGSGPASPSQPSDLPPTRMASGNVFPFLPLRGLVAFPHVSYPIFVGRAASIKAVQFAKDQKVSIVLAAQKDPILSSLSSSDLYEVGTIAIVVDVQRLPDGTLKSVIEGKSRARVNRYILDEDFSKADAVEIEEAAISDASMESLVSSVVSAFVHRRVSTVAKAFGNPEALSVSATTTDGASVLADRIASELQMDLGWKQALLELLNPADRLEKLLAFLSAST